MTDPSPPVRSPDESDRLSALTNLGILDSPPERDFDELTRLAAAAAGTASAAVTLIDERRQWFKARHNIPFTETPRNLSFCAHALAALDVLVVPDAAADPLFRDNPLVTADGGIRFYAGFPLVLASGHCVGALCVFDPSPRDGLSAVQRALLADLAKIATDLVESWRFRQMGQIAARVVDTTSDAVLCIDDAGLLTFWSRGAERMFGRTAEEAIGRTLDLILPPALAARHHHGFRRAVAGGRTTLVGKAIELTAMRADGSEFPIELSLARWGGRHNDRDNDRNNDRGFAAIVRDTSQRQRLERERRHARDFLDAVVAHLPAMLFVKDAASGEYLLVNRAAEQLIGRPAAEIVGRTDVDLFPDHGEGYERRDREAMRATAPRTFESAFTRDDGAEVRLRTKRIVIDGPERPRQYILGMSEDVTEVRKAEAEVLRLAHFDSLTGLLNRGSYVDRLHRLVAAATPIALLSIDLDRFKAVNDQFGHLLGDEVLAEVGDRLRAAVGPSDLVARTGGDEFALVVIGREPGERAQRLAEAIVADLARPFLSRRGTAHIGASIGIALSPGDARTTDELRQCVDLALYRAKEAGRGTVCCFSAEMDAHARDRQTIESDLRAAVAHGDIRLLYQPVLSVETGQVSSVEALARWTHPTRGPVRPDVFISLAEECGLINTLGEQLLRRACADALSWPGHIRVAVNLSPLQFQTDALCGTVRDALAATGLPPDRLQLEVTEGLVIRDVDRTFAQLERLRALGIQVLMDDFGVGYSSLSYFERFRFDKVKIDRSFVSGIAGSRSSRAIVKAVIGLGQELGMGIVAEGVETDEQMQLLIELGCTHLQGFFFSQPLDAAMVAGVSGRVRTNPPLLEAIVA